MHQKQYQIVEHNHALSSKKSPDCQSSVGINAIAHAFLLYLGQNRTCRNKKRHYLISLDQQD